MSFEKIDLPSGGWVAFRDPEQTTEAQREPVMMLAIRASGSGLWPALQGEVSMNTVTDAELTSISDFSRALAIALIEEWSFEQPVTIDGLKSIPGLKDYRTIIEAAARHRDALMPNFEVDPDTESPTPASEG